MKIVVGNMFIAKMLLAAVFGKSWPELFRKTLERFVQLPTTPVFIYRFRLNQSDGETTAQQHPLPLCYNPYFPNDSVRFGM